MSGERDAARQAPASATSYLTRAERLAVLAIFGGLGLLESARGYIAAGLAGRDVSLAHVLVGNLPWWLGWAALVPVILYTARRARFGGGGTARAVAVHVVAAVALSVLHHAVVGSLYFYTHTRGFDIFAGGQILPATPWRQVQAFFAAYFLLNILTYAAVLAGYLGLEYYKRFREGELRSLRLESAMHEARLAALRMELDPHFLFNALNAVSGLVRSRENDRAVRMLARVSQLLRSTLEDARDPEVPLQRELELLRIYLDIESVRFGDRLEVDLDARPEALSAFVPPLILQPLVENAIRHGVARHEGPARLEIRARVVDRRLEIEIENSGGPDCEPVPEYAGGGIGLSNTRERLRHFYGEGAAIELRMLPEGGAVARIVAPLRSSDAVVPAAASLPPLTGAVE